MKERAFSFLHVNERQGKPRTHGITEIRGPYYISMGRHYLEDLLEIMGETAPASVCATARAHRSGDSRCAAL